MSDEPKRRGRPRKYPADVAKDGAPQMMLRLDPELKDWVVAQAEARGLAAGQDFIRELIVKAKAAADRRSPSSGHGEVRASLKEMSERYDPAMRRLAD